LEYIELAGILDELEMITVGAFEAKSHLSAPLDRVAAGEEAIITKYGKPVARLVGARQVDKPRVNEAFEKLKALRSGTTLGGLSWKELRDEGRR
jgi:prevent-host-death family protein